MRRRALALLFLLIAAVAAAGDTASAHGVSRRDAAFVSTVTGPVPVPFAYLGAKHMVTGYDHLLFLVGVVFFLFRLRDVVTYVSLFTLGHSVTLLVGVIADVHANAYLIDAVIGLSVVYKGFENIGGFTSVFGITPDTRLAVLVFGLFHGFGLATKLQELSMPPAGLATNLVSFNIGVEIGQGVALTAVLAALMFWRSRAGFDRHAFTANTALMIGGFLLIGYQLTGFFATR